MRRQIDVDRPLGAGRLVMGPFGRVEGDLEVRLDLDEGRVREARVVSSLYRGFERMLHGREPADALVYTPRICGICSVSQSVAAARALATLAGIEPPLNGQLATSLVLASENMADHLSHFYLFFMPDFAGSAYAGQPWHGQVERRFAAIHGSAATEWLTARASLLQLMGIVAGKWPHSLTIQPGGTTRALGRDDRATLRQILFAFRRFLERTLFGDRLEAVAELDSIEALQRWRSTAPDDHGDLRRFLLLAERLQLEQLGVTDLPLMSYGAYPVAGEWLLRPGVTDRRQCRVEELQPESISEDHSHAWLAHRSEARHPFDGVTQPDPDSADGYSWCKAPRLAGRVVEVGALARQLVAGQPLIASIFTESGANVRNRVVARLLELAVVVPQMERWLGSISPGAPFCLPATLREEGSGVGLVEAARGSLGHWFRVKNGRILTYQIIAPTTWNFSPRDHLGQPGALEQALAGTPVDDGDQEPVAVQHIVRSFDPCMVCTVH